MVVRARTQRHRHLRRCQPHRDRQGRLPAAQVRGPQRADLPEPEADRRARPEGQARADVIADGAATYQGELALGRNVLVAFMAWDGYNFEDAIIISERAGRRTTPTPRFTSRSSTSRSARPSWVARSSPATSPTSARRPCATSTRTASSGSARASRPGDILVGKVSPEVQERADARGEAAARDLRPGRRGREERLAGSARRASRASSSTPRSSRRRMSLTEERAEGVREGSSRTTEATGNARIAEAFGQLVDAARDGAREAGDRRRQQAAGRGAGRHRYVAEQAQRVPARQARRPQPAAQGRRSRRSTRLLAGGCEAAIDDRDRKLNSLKRGDELPSGVLEMVKVYIATKRVISVGDKMAGRHGNKGVIAKILPEEDMPFLDDGTPVRHPAEPAGRAQPYERRPDPRDAPGLGGGQARLPGDHPGLRRRHRGRRSAQSPGRGRPAASTARPCSTTAGPASRSSRR